VYELYQPVVEDGKWTEGLLEMWWVGLGGVELGAWSWVVGAASTIVHVQGWVV